MRPFRGLVWVGALVLLGAMADSADAAWNNVFQTCCWHHRSRSSASFYAPAPACCPQPQPVCCPPQYQQRCYYQPVTTYETRTYYEPVTTYRTSYYYEPVTSYRYSCYYDPCTCSYQQVATPVTSYQLRAQNCPVQSWVQRCAVVPVQSYRKACYLEPVCPTSGPSGPAVTEQSNYPPLAPPNVTEKRLPGGNGVPERIQPQPDSMPPASYRQFPSLQAPPPTTKPAQPPVKLERFVSLPGKMGQVEGQIVTGDSNPKADTQLHFVSADPDGSQQVVASDRNGRFQITLTSGEWLVYVNGKDGKVFHGKIAVRGEETRQMTLVSK